MKHLKSKFIYLLGLVIYFMVLPTFLLVSTTSCNSQKGHTMKKKKLKRGRPIPCPVKDC